MNFSLHLGDCLEVLRSMPENSVDSVVTDPPYGIRFMGKAWDGQDIVEMTKRDRPKGGENSLAMSAGKYSRTYEDMLCFEEFTLAWAKEAIRVLKPGGHILVFCSPRSYHRMACGIEDAGFEIRDQVQWLFGSGFPKSHNLDGEWKGWGTALKPANEPICLARKPLSEKTVAANVLKWGTGAINVDGCRVEGKKRSPEFKNPESELGYHRGSANKNLVNWDSSRGRWPANLILDEEAAEMLDEQSGTSKSNSNQRNNQPSKNIAMSGDNTGHISFGHNDSGGASRFFYVAKASKSERNAGLGQSSNGHPCVKPIRLMSYLCRLITPPNGIVLDPFTGSGSTGVAAIKEGFNFIGIELNPEYMQIAKKRIEAIPANPGGRK